MTGSVAISPKLTHYPTLTVVAFVSLVVRLGATLPT